MIITLRTLILATSTAYAIGSNCDPGEEKITVKVTGFVVSNVSLAQYKIIKRRSFPFVARSNKLTCVALNRIWLLKVTLLRFAAPRVVAFKRRIFLEELFNPTLS